MNTKDEYVQFLHKKLDQWSADIDKLSAKISEIDAESKVEVNKQIETLQSKREELEEKIKLIQHSSEDAWQDIQAGAELLYETMDQTVRSVLSRFK